MIDDKDSKEVLKAQFKEINNRIAEARARVEAERENLQSLKSARDAIKSRLDSASA